MTTTELLFKVAERISKTGEGEDILVIWNHGQTARLSGNCNYTRALGLAQFAVAELSNSLISSEGGDARDEDKENKTPQ